MKKRLALWMKKHLNLGAPKKILTDELVGVLERARDEIVSLRGQLRCAIEARVDAGEEMAKAIELCNRSRAMEPKIPLWMVVDRWDMPHIGHGQNVFKTLKMAERAALRLTQAATAAHDCNTYRPVQVLLRTEA